MNVLLTPHGGTVTNVNLNLDGYHATVSCDASKTRVCPVIPELNYARHVAITVSVSIPGNVKKSSVKVTAYASATNAAEAKGYAAFSVVRPKASKSPSSKPSHPSRSGSGSGNGAQSPAPIRNLNPSPGNSVPAPSTAPQDSAVLPTIGQQQPAQSPSTAPLLETTGNSQSMRGAAEGPDELTFDELASTQAAWLAALLVAFSLLLTQLRLGRAGARTAKGTRSKGAHRKTRGRLRGSRAL